MAALNDPVTLAELIEGQRKKIYQAIIETELRVPPHGWVVVMCNKMLLGHPIFPPGYGPVFIARRQLKAQMATYQDDGLLLEANGGWRYW